MQQVVGYIIYPAYNGIHATPELENLKALDFGPAFAIHIIYKLALAWSLVLVIAYFKPLALVKEYSDLHIHCS